MSRRYGVGISAAQSANTVANSLRAILGLPIDNVVGGAAQLDFVHICESQEAGLGLQCRLQIARVTLANIPAGGTNTTDGGAGAGKPWALDPSNSLASRVGSNSSYLCKHSYNDAAVTVASIVGEFGFYSNAGIILSGKDLEDAYWNYNSALMFLISHGSGSAAPKWGGQVCWKE